VTSHLERSFPFSCAVTFAIVSSASPPSLPFHHSLSSFSIPALTFDFCDIFIAVTNRGETPPFLSAVTPPGNLPAAPRLPPREAFFRRFRFSASLPAHPSSLFPVHPPASLLAPFPASTPPSLHIATRRARRRCLLFHPTRPLPHSHRLCPKSPWPPLFPPRTSLPPARRQPVSSEEFRPLVCLP
jgi:hypothetical protein